MAACLDSPQINPAVQEAAAQSVPVEARRSPPPPPPPAPVVEQLPKSIEAFDVLIDHDVKAFVDCSQKIGEPISEQVK